MPQHKDRAGIAPARVLLVDDIDFNRELLEAYLEPLGLEVFEASHGVEALRLLRECPVDLILTDIEMPVMNGYELAQALMADPLLRQIPRLAVTGSVPGRDHGKIETVFNGCLSKPICMQVLTDEVLRLLPGPTDGSASV